MFDRLKKGYRDVVSKIKEPPQESQFLEKGILTPDEFVQACDKLKQINPIWNWGSAAQPKLTNKYLPESKQFIYADIVSRFRLSNQEDDIEIEDEKGFQVIKIDNIESNEITDKDLQLDTNTQQKEEEQKQPQKKTQIIDSSDEEDGDEIQETGQNNNQGEVHNNDQNEELRNYRVYITYDLYYHTPRFWLSGKNYKNEPLSKKEIFEEIMSEYVNKTATEENHPQLNIPMVFIHPCKHASVVKSLSDQAIKNGKKITVDQYMFVFLKFISSVMPSLELDFTTEIEF